MAVYKNDNPSHFAAALESIKTQSVPPEEIVVVRDGPVSDGMEDVLSLYKKSLPIKYLKLESNEGLPRALNYGLQHVTQPWIGRFDADDINRDDRFQSQIEVIKCGGFELVGGHAAEFDSDPNKIIGCRKVPISSVEIMRRIKYRNPFNHMTVCMKADILRAVGGYPDVRYMQDYCLWVNMMSYGVSCVNLDKVLVNVRVDGVKMYKRRFNYQVIKNEIVLRRMLIQCGVGSVVENLSIGLARVAVLSSPVLIRKAFYQNILRKRE